MIFTSLPQVPVTSPLDPEAPLALRVRGLEVRDRWRPVESHGIWGIFNDFQGKLMEKYGKIMENMGKSWKNVGKYGKIMGKIPNSWRLTSYKCIVSKIIELNGA